MPLTFTLLAAALHRWQRCFLAGKGVCVCARASACAPVSWCNLDACIDNCIPVASDEQ